MTRCHFASDLHGHTDRYRKLFAIVADERPAALFLGGDLLPSGLAPCASPETAQGGFVDGFLAAEFGKLRRGLADAYPRVLLILGNDDPRSEERAVLDAAARGAWEYMHKRKTELHRFGVYGYACVPPTPFLLKDWERYDVSRHVDVGCVPPEDGHRSVPVSTHAASYATIREDLEELVDDGPLEQTVFLFHAPPYDTNLDRAALDDRIIDHVQVDVHVGSIAVRQFIEARQPLLTLHGHIHESARITHSWMDTIGRTVCLSAAHDGPELALVRFALEDPAAATRELI